MQNNRNRLWIGTLCLLSLVGQQALRADDGQPDPAKPVTLTQPVKAKDTVEYKLTQTLSVNGTDVVVEQNRKYTVKEVKSNGDRVIEMANLGGKVTFGGSDQEIPAGSSITITESKSGKVLTYVPESDNNPYLSTPTLHLLTMVDQTVFPDKPVKPGDSWTTEEDNPAVKGKKVTIKSTFVGLDKVDGVPAWIPHPCNLASSASFA